MTDQTPGKARKVRKAPKSKTPKAAKTPRRRKAAPPEGAWVTPAGYRLADRLAALDPDRAGSERIALLATEIIDQHLRLGKRGLALCGAAQGTGVSFIAANLAIALAQAGVSILLVDADLTGPKLHELITPPQDGPGLAQLISNPDLHLADAIHSDVLPGLSLLYAGDTAGVGADRLSSEPFQAVAQNCLREFDLTLFDTPPANRSPGALAVATAAGYALLVARRGSSFADDVTTLVGELEQDGVELVGSVLNNA